MKRVRYISRASMSVGPDEIDQIIAASERNNPGRNVTGMLVASGELFYQLLEGPTEEVDNLYAKIAQDDRHDQIILIEEETGTFDRICPDWAMLKVDLSTKSAADTAPIGAMLEMICVQRQMAQRALKTLDDYTWEKLLATELERN